MTFNFEEDIRQHVLHELRREPAADPPLNAMDAHELLIVYRNWLNRLVSIHPRMVHLSKAMIANPLTTDGKYAPGLAAITSKIQRGTDVTPHLSRGIKYGYDPATVSSGAALQRRRDLDLLLNDWGVHHLHLSTDLESDGFVKRDGPVLFAAFRSDDVYFIDIMQHGDWTREHVLEVIVDEWPGAGLVQEVPEAAGVGYTPTEDDLKKLRKSGISTLIQIHGKSYRPVAGLTTAGVSLVTMQTVLPVFESIKWFERKLIDDPNFVAQAMSGEGVAVPADPELHFAFFQEGGYGVIERKSGFRFRLKH
jgi:hypothetical protein